LPKKSVYCRRLSCRLFCGILLGAVIGGGAQAAENGPRKSAAPASESAIVARAGLPGAAVGFVLYDLMTRRQLVAKSAGRLFVPASVAKVATTVAALEMLGPDYRFETKVYVSGAQDRKNGTLPGDLYLVGGGDPMLTGDQMREMIAGLAAGGLRGVSGGFYYDQSLLVTARRISDEQRDDAPHNTGIGALSVNFNRVQVSWTKTGKVNGFKAITTSNTDRMKVEIDVIKFAIGKRGTRWPYPFRYVGDGVNGARWLVAPYIRRRGKVWLPVRQPGLTAAAVFRKLGAGGGIALSPPKPGVLPKGARLAQTYRSRKLIEIVRRVMRYSNNTAAELTGLVATRKQSGKPLDLGQSGAVVSAWFKARIPQANWTGFVLRNHSGLTLKTRISPAQMLAILLYARSKRYGSATYASLLKPYTLKRSAAPAGRYSVRAKSGTMNYIRGRAGYITTARGRELAFALFITQPDARRDERSGKRKARRTLGPRSWMFRARKLEHDLIAKWVKAY
jgi:serine-type D-Ala-D-Ala carboxypeptidase/endopeptidase (penicillin-binding protein 4)